MLSLSILSLTGNMYSFVSSIHPSIHPFCLARQTFVHLSIHQSSRLCIY